jgi:hypothetical protein
MKSFLLALAILGSVSTPVLAGTSNPAVPGYLGSRAYTHKLNPLGWFGITRFIGARGLLGRIKAGTVDKGVLSTDKRSIARILYGTGMSYQAASTQAAEVVAQSRAGMFNDGGKTYPISRFFTSRIAQTVVGFVNGAGIGGLVTSAADRAIVPRALAGRLNAGKPLLESEKRLLSAIKLDPAQLATLESR